MDNQSEFLRDRLRAACGNLPDAAHVTVSVGDLLACIRAIEDVADLQAEMGDVLGLEQECDELRRRIADLEAELDAVDCAA